MGLRDAEIILGWILAFYGALIGIILVHEVGHLVAVLALGFRLILIRVGPFEYSEADGWSRKLGDGRDCMADGRCCSGRTDGKLLVGCAGQSNL